MKSIMIDLTKKPFYLSESDIKWVNETLKEMSIQDKVKQLFVDMINTTDKAILEVLVEERKFGGVRYTNRDAKTLQTMINTLQNCTKVPLLVASNAESGGNGACSNGTEIGCGVKIGATGNKEYAYKLGNISAKEALACGCNITFAPVVDINMNFHNPIISSRSFGSDPKLVRDYSLEYLKGAHDAGIACCAKHFPGDGVDERDQHLSYNVNTLSCDNWDNTFGDVYKTLIDNDLEAVMIGHIMLPSYQSKYNPNGERLVPATISKEIITNLLRDKLGFNGLVITDATHMVGFTGINKRSELLTLAINAGCDMLLFYNDFQEDLDYVMSSVESGKITLDRLNEAVIRILALKAHLKLHKGNNQTSEELLSNVGKDEYKIVQRSISKDAITLVKNNDNIFPLTSSKYKKILIVPLESTNALSKFGSIFARGVNYIDYFKGLLEKEGFEVSVFESLEKKLEHATKEELLTIMNELYAQKTSIESVKAKYDAVIYLANIGGNGTVQRLNWAFTKGSLDVPWYSHELPIIFVSLACPFHLFDVPEVQTYINCYDKQNHTLEALVDKLVGKDTFRGTSSVDAFCGREELKL